MTVITEMYDNINRKLYSGLVTLDLTKAFDIVCHKRLLVKLDHYGIRGIALELISPYLTNRSPGIRPTSPPRGTRWKQHGYVG